MSKEDFNDFAEKVKTLATEIRAGVCPIWQCGGELEYIEDRTNWQEPDLKCKNCGNVWLIQKYNNEETEPDEKEMVCDECKDVYLKNFVTTKDCPKVDCFGHLKEK